jgi:hypothetical protein
MRQCQYCHRAADFIFIAHCQFEKGSMRQVEYARCKMHGEEELEQKLMRLEILLESETKTAQAQRAE